MSLPSIAGPEPDIHTPPAPPPGVTFQIAGVGVKPASRLRPRTSYATTNPCPGPRGFSPLIENETTTALFPAASVSSPRPARIFWYGVVNPFAIAPPPLSALPAISTGGFLFGERVRVEDPEHVVALGVRAVGVGLAERRDVDRVRRHVDDRRRRDSPVVIDQPSIHLARVRTRIERRSELARDELRSGVHVEDVRRVRHGEHVELVAHDERRDVDLFVDQELANLLQLRDARGRQHGFEPVPALASVVDANGRHIDRVRPRRREPAQRSTSRRSRVMATSCWLCSL